MKYISKKIAHAINNVSDPKMAYDLNNLKISSKRILDFSRDLLRFTHNNLYMLCPASQRLQIHPPFYVRDEFDRQPK